MIFAAFLLTALAPVMAQNVRRPAGDAALRPWLESMVWHHGFSVAEVQSATGLAPAEIASALQRFGIREDNRPRRPAGAPLLVLPYPGGRHPRIGFLEGAVDPQRETKLSVFTPWDDRSYVVADVPEAIWSNLGLTYLAHTHVPTVWTKASVTLPALEWARRANGDYFLERTLPNGIRFGTQARATPEALVMKMWLFNGTTNALTDLRVQNCVMLKGAAEFNAQTNANKVARAPFIACRSNSGQRWVITAWQPLHRVWDNPPVPCLHADPKFPNTAPSQTNTLHGFLSFYQGTDIQSEFDRLDRVWPSWRF
jgi:hypothetical protein